MDKFKRFFTPKLAIVLSLMAACYWLFVAFFNPYDWAVVGAIYELLWLPMILLLLGIPVLCISVTIFGKFYFRWGYLIAFVISIATFIILNSR